MTPDERAAADRAIGRSAARTRVRKTVDRDRRRAGFRTPREIPLLEDDLYEGGIIPGPQQNTDPDLTCTICLNTKAHPVKYVCTHSHCYACIRLWLQRQWTCPLCQQLIKHAPRRDYPQEQAIAALYPAWANST
ncbi:hypothetical protein B0H15DRAFT_956466 [Mycena belliarum]|uniref:RING-type domain-containing protein n=1 Tax=Mycena belliarum TaxID=1033014 RepID=A0AAD6XJC0_9AGAR|nr:hypothetical protein B0H15DRAFT_956466 [Mycena belliae]